MGDGLGGGDSLSVKEWDPLAFLSSPAAAASSSESRSSSSSHLKTALIVINTPIIRKDVFETVWSNSSLKYCADGGANRVYDAFGDDPSHLPDLIKGDFDSLRPDVRSFYEKKGVRLEQDKDEYATDLDKCIKSLVDVEERESESYQLVIYGGLSGRLDQTAHTLHKLHKLRKEREWSWVVSEESLTCVLDVGKHRIQTPNRLVGKTCGLLPLGVDSAFVQTKGLEWDMPIDGARTSMDTMISTSNHLAAEVVEVETDRPIVWTVELRPPKIQQ